MEIDKRRAIIIASVAVSLIVVIGLILIWPRLNKPKAVEKKWYAARLLHQTNRFADSVGIDTSRFTTKQSSDSVGDIAAKATLKALLLELRYGQRPSQFIYNGLTENIDSAWAESTAKQEIDTFSDSTLRGTSFGPYQALVQQYQRVRGKLPADSLRTFWQTLNFYRYLNRFPMDRFAVVNIPAAELTVFDQTGKRLLTMDVIAGKVDHKTPCMATSMNQITMYPYWNVPKGIGLAEILPKVRRNVSFLDAQNMQVLNQKNEEIDPYSVDWASFSPEDAEGFPYRFRQSSGCHNALGLLKFELKNPFAIYLHDTNGRDLFTQSADRFRSHGCVRVQKPVELANLILNKQVFDDGFMNRCLLDQKPKSLPLPQAIPVFIVYHTTDVDANGKAVFYQDVYGLRK